MRLEPILNSSFFQKVGPANLLLNYFVRPICKKSYLESFRSWNWPADRIPPMREQPIVQNLDLFFRMRKIINITFVVTLSLFVLGNFALKAFSVTWLVLVVASPIILSGGSRDFILSASRLGIAWAEGCAYAEYIRLLNSGQPVSDFVQRGADQYIRTFRTEDKRFKNLQIRDLWNLFHDYILSDLPQNIQRSIKQFDGQHISFMIAKLFFVYSLGRLSAERLPKIEIFLESLPLFTPEMQETIEMLRQMKQTGVISKEIIQVCRTVFANPENYPDQLPEIFKNMIAPHLRTASSGVVGQVMMACFIAP